MTQGRADATAWEWGMTRKMRHSDNCATVGFLKECAGSYDVPRLQRAARDCGKVRTRKFFSQALKADMASHVR
jgi:hypothetical protein